MNIDVSKLSCVCPTFVGQFISMNDSIQDDARRTELILPLIPKVLGTRVSKTAAGDAVLLKRVFICMDWYIRVRTPAFLRFAGLNDLAAQLEAQPNIIDQETLDACNSLCSAAQSAARSAAWSAARSAAWSAAWSAARSAAWSAAQSAAWSAAWSAAESAAQSAAWSAAESALEKIVKEVQDSWAEMILRMAAVHE